MGRETETQRDGYIKGERERKRERERESERESEREMCVDIGGDIYIYSKT